jgi:predicted ATP-grasp superfamily ATP-dependent carboligase
MAPARWSRHVARTVRCPASKNASALLDWLLRFGAAHPGHVLYPTSDEMAWLVAAHAKELSRSFRLYAPPIGALLRLLDKALLAENARAVGLDAPETRVPHDEWEVEQSGRELGVPLYVKPRAQTFGRGTGKGARVDEPAALLAAWRTHRSTATYDAEVLDIVPDVCLPMLQSSSSGAERIYTVDGFVDESGELFTTLACVKVLQRPRGSGPGIIFEHAESDPAVDEGLRRLFRMTGFCGVFDAEFIEHGTRKLLIDINPRFYNHMAFETDRGLHLPWLAYLAATGDRQALKEEVDKTKNARVPGIAYVHRLPTAMMLTVQGFMRAMPREDRLRWRRWISDHRGAITDPARAAGDPAPAVAEVVMEALNFARHPRAFLRGLLRSPNLSRH